MKRFLAGTLVVLLVHSLTTQPSYAALDDRQNLFQGNKSTLFTSQALIPGLREIVPSFWKKDGVNQRRLETAEALRAQAAQTQRPLAIRFLRFAFWPTSALFFGGLALRLWAPHLGDGLMLFSMLTPTKGWNRPHDNPAAVIIKLVYERGPITIASMLPMIEAACQREIPFNVVHGILKNLETRNIVENVTPHHEEIERFQLTPHARDKYQDVFALYDNIKFMHMTRPLQKSLDKAIDALDLMGRKIAEPLQKQVATGGFGDLLMKALGNHQASTGQTENSAPIGPIHQPVDSTVQKSETPVKIEPVAAPRLPFPQGDSNGHYDSGAKQDIIREAKELRGKNWPEALKKIDQALLARPNKASSLTLKAGILIGLARHEEALDIAQRLIEIKRTDVPAYVVGAKALSKLSRYDEALNMINRGLEIDRNNRPALIVRAKILNSLGRFRESLETTDVSLRLEGGRIETWLARAQSFNGLWRYEEALGETDKALQADSRHVATIIIRMATLNKLNRNIESLKLAAMALEVEPDSANVHRLKFHALYGLGRYEDALQNLEDLSRLSPRTLRDRTAMAQVLNKLGRTSEALEHLEMARQEDPSDLTIYLIGTHIYNGHGQHDEARKFVAPVLARDDTFRTLSEGLNMATIFHDVRYYERGLRIIQTVIELAPHSADAKKLAEELKRDLRKPDGKKYSGPTVANAFGPLEWILTVHPLFSIAAAGFALALVSPQSPTLWTVFWGVSTVLAGFLSEIRHLFRKALTRTELLHAA